MTHIDSTNTPPTEAPPPATMPPLAEAAATQATYSFLNRAVRFFAIPSNFGWGNVAGFYKPVNWSPTNWCPEERLVCFYLALNVLGYFLGTIAGILRIVFSGYQLYRGKSGGVNDIPLNSSQKTFLWVQIARGAIELTGFSLVLLIPDAFSTWSRWSNNQLTLVIPLQPVNAEA